MTGDIWRDLVWTGNLSSFIESTEISLSSIGWDNRDADPVSCVICTLRIIKLSMSHFSLYLSDYSGEHALVAVDKQRHHNPLSLWSRRGYWLSSSSSPSRQSSPGVAAVGAGNVVTVLDLHARTGNTAYHCSRILMTDLPIQIHRAAVSRW